MPNEHFCLKWNNFQNNIVSALVDLKSEEDFVDVTLSVEGRTIKAHKVILSACSDYFREVFRDNPCNHPIVILRDAAFEDVEGLVRYVYRGEVDVLPERLQSFLRTAELLQIKGLADQNLNKHNDQDEERVAESVTPQPTMPCTLNVPNLGFLPNNFLPQQQLQKQHQEIMTPPPSIPPMVSSSSPVLHPQVAAAISPVSQILSSPIRVPVPPTSGLRPNHFSNLAQYLSGGSVTSPPHVDSVDTSTSKRRKTFPKKKNESNMSFYGVQTTDTPPHYSGSISSSPPHSHSTEGEGPLEICEESDRESGRSSESTDYSLKSPKVVHGHQQNHRQTYHDNEEHPLVIEDKENSDDLTSSYGETLDLSKRQEQRSSDNRSIGGESSTASEGMVSPPHPIFTHLPILPLHISTQGPLTGSVCLTESLASRGSLPATVTNSSQSCVTQFVLTTPDAHSQVVDCSVNRVDMKKSKIVKSSTKKSTGKQIDTGHIDNDESKQQHPRNRWRCMQPRTCNFCAKTFSNSFNLKQHIVNVHIQSQGVTCTLCSKVVKNKWYLRKHLVTAHGAPLKRIKPDSSGTCNGKKSAKKPMDLSMVKQVGNSGSNPATRSDGNDSN